MTVSAQYGISLSAGGQTIQQSVTRTADSAFGYDVNVAAAKALSGWYKNAANDGGGNLANGHTYTNGQYDVYWTGGRRYDMAGTITVDAIVLAGGSGNDFPTNGNNTVVVCKHQQVNSLIDGDLVEIIGVAFDSNSSTSTARAHLHCEDADGDVIADLDYNANQPVIYDIDAGVSNPFTGDIIRTSFVTTNSTNETITAKIVGIQDSTP